MSAPINKGQNAMFQSTFQKMSWLISKCLQHALALVALIGLFAGGWQYLEKQRQGRVEHTMRLLDKFHSPPFATSRGEINKATFDNEGKITEAALTSKEELAKVILNMVRQQPDLDSHLSNVFEFYDAVCVCARNNICDAAVADDFFLLYAKTHYANFYQYIEAQRTGLKSGYFAKGLENFVSKQQSCRKST